jgi:hypothetical protein
VALNRRQLLVRGGRLAAVAATSGAWALDRLADPASAAGTLRKCISLGGPGPLREEGHPDDYRLWGNREYIRDTSATSWVKLWVSWFDLQQELGQAPPGRAASWRHLDGAPAGKAWLRRLDRQLRAVNDDRLGAILTLYHAYPTWASGATGADPADPAKPPERKLPLDLSPDGPWGWFVAYLVARYRRGSAGNPDGAWIDALEICNEPNNLAWPQEGVVEATAQMIRSATEVSAVWGGTPILAPATSDFPDSTTGGSLGVSGTVWSDFTLGVLTALTGFRSPVPLRWSHHNYRDVRLGTTRAADVLGMLRAAGWWSDLAPLWLTEGGINLGSAVDQPAARRFQGRAIEQSFRRTMALPDAYLWTQHTISDKAGNGFKSGLRDDFDPGGGPGPVRPAWFVWRDLPGTLGP